MHVPLSLTATCQLCPVSQRSGRNNYKGHNYRVIVSDLQRGRPIWVGGEGRKEADIDLFFKALGEQKSAHIELAVMDMWKPFRNSVMKNAPNARIIYDKFHIMRHLSKALDEVRRREYQRLSGKDRSYIKGQRYTLLSRRENLSLDGRRALKKLLQANKRLNTAYVLKESFGQLWDYRSERGARAFFERWKDSLKWQRLEPYRKFAKLIESHWTASPPTVIQTIKSVLDWLKESTTKSGFYNDELMDIVTRTISSSKSLLHFFRLYPEMPISTHTFPRRPYFVLREKVGALGTQNAGEFIRCQAQDLTPGGMQR